MFKVGDKVRIKSLDWYNSNKLNGHVKCKNEVFTERMSKYCGLVTTIERVLSGSKKSGLNDRYFLLNTDYWFFTNQMFDLIEEVEPESKKKSYGFFIEQIINGEPKINDNVFIRIYDTKEQRDKSMQEYEFTHEDTKDTYQLTPFTTEKEV